MERTERIYRIQTLLSQYRVVPKSQFIEELGISLATFKRDLAYLRDRMGVPIEFAAESGGYRRGGAGLGGNYELPGMWFNADEIHALLTMQQLLQELQPGLLTPHVKPLMVRLQRLLDSPDASTSEVQKRIRVMRANARAVNSAAFNPVSTAVLGRRRITIRHFHRTRNHEETRTVSPQRLTYYRDNWYLDAWCHLREGIRSFSLDAIQKAQVLDEAAVDIPYEELDAVFAAGYGIFSGKDVQWAELRFSPERARWVSREMWHPQQQGKFEADGHYVLRVPYSDDRELVMDILRHVPEVGVVGPQGLRERVRELLKKGLEIDEI